VRRDSSRRLDASCSLCRIEIDKAGVNAVF
jgi:hypothetical protein